MFIYWLLAVDMCADICDELFVKPNRSIIRLLRVVLAPYATGCEYCHHCPIDPDECDESHRRRMKKERRFVGNINEQEILKFFDMLHLYPKYAAKILSDYHQRGLPWNLDEEMVRAMFWEWPDNTTVESFAKYVDLPRFLSIKWLCKRQPDADHQLNLIYTEACRRKLEGVVNMMMVYGYKPPVHDHRYDYVEFITRNTLPDNVDRFFNDHLNLVHQKSQGEREYISEEEVFLWLTAFFNASKMTPSFSNAARNTPYYALFPWVPKESRHDFEVMLSSNKISGGNIAILRDIAHQKADDNELRWVRSFLEKWKNDVEGRLIEGMASIVRWISTVPELSSLFRKICDVAFEMEIPWFIEKLVRPGQ